MIFYGSNLSGTSPTIAVSAPASLSLNISHNETATFKVKVTDVDDNIAGTEWYLNGGNPVLKQNLGDGQGTGADFVFEFNHKFIVTGDDDTDTLEVIAYDINNVVSNTITWSILKALPNIRPVVTSYSPSQNEIAVGENIDQEFLIQIENAQGNLRGIKWYKNTQLLDEQILNSTEQSNSSVTFSKTTTFNNFGKELFSATIYDNTGDITEIVWVIKTGFSNISAAPEITQNTSNAGVINIAEGEKLNFEVSARDSNYDLRGIVWYGLIKSHCDDDSTLVTHYINSQNATGDNIKATFSVENTFDVAGEYTVAAVVFDAESDSSELIEWSITVGGGVANAPPNITLIQENNNPVNNSEVTIAEGTELEFKIDAVDADCNLSGAEWYDGINKASLVL